MPLTVKAGRASAAVKAGCTSAAVTATGALAAKENAIKAIGARRNNWRKPAPEQSG
jgi:uncharacterized transporter YbjL